MSTSKSPFRFEMNSTPEQVMRACRLALSSRLHHPSEEYVLREMMQAHLADGELFTAICIAYLGSLPIGVLTHDTLSRVTVYVRAEARRQGVARSLWRDMSAHLAHLPDASCAYGNSNDGGLDFWNSMAWRDGDEAGRLLKYNPWAFAIRS